MFIYRKFTSILSLFVIIFSLMSSGFQSVPVSAQGRDGVNTATVTPTGIPVATETPIPIKTLPSAETSVQTDTSLPPELPASPEVSSSVFIPLAVTTWYVTTTGLDFKFLYYHRISVPYHQWRNRQGSYLWRYDQSSSGNLHRQ